MAIHPYVVISCIKNDVGINKLTFVKMIDKNLLPFLTMTESYQKEMIQQAVSFTPQRGSNTVKNWNKICKCTRIQWKVNANIHTCIVVSYSHTALFYIFRVRQAWLSVILIKSGLTHKRMKATWDWRRMQECVISAIVWSTMANQWTQWNKEKH